MHSRKCQRRRGLCRAAYGALTPNEPQCKWCPGNCAGKWPNYKPLKVHCHSCLRGLSWKIRSWWKPLQVPEIEPEGGNGRAWAAIMPQRRNYTQWLAGAQMMLRLHGAAYFLFPTSTKLSPFHVLEQNQQSQLLSVKNETLFQFSSVINPSLFL